MDLSTITIADFKAQFVRDFPYLPEWDVAELYNTGNIVYYSTTKLFYIALNNGVTSVPTTVADWAIHPDSIENYVLDADITRAFGEAEVSLNQPLFGSDANITLAYLYLTAHYLVLDLRAALSGIAGNGDFNQSSRSVGNVSTSYAIPAAFLDDPIVQYYSKTSYGQKFLSFALPRLAGNIATAEGGTRA
jgi:hypothetical protein